MTSDRRREDLQFKWILDALPTAIYAVDRGGSFQFVNSAFSKLFGFDSPDELVGKSVTSLYLPPDDRQTVLRLIESKADTSRPYIIRARRRDGTIVLLRVDARHSSELIEGRVTLVQPISEEEARTILGGPRVFISYSHNDHEFVGSLAKDLVDEGVAVWLDKWEIDVGESIPSRIGKAIADCDFLVAVLTPASLRSRWFREELDSAHVKELESHGTVILPALKEDCQAPPLLKSKRYADFRASYSEGLTALVTAIRHLHERTTYDLPG